MTPDAEGLHRIANTTNPDRRADIVFVHGLGGGSHSTWRHGKLGKPGHFFWPEALGEDLPDCGIWTVGYPAGITKLGKPGMIVAMRAGNLAQKLADAGFGERPLFFVTHSMGGLVVKSLVVDSQTLPDPDRKRLVGTIRGIVFCATPHRGSAFADAAGALCPLLGGRQAHVKEMRANAQPLDLLHDEFVEWHRHHPIPVLSYAENIGLFKTRWYWRPLPLGLVVPRASANPGLAGHTVRDMDDDHLTLVKPPDREHGVYAGALRFIRATLGERPPKTPNGSKDVSPPGNPKADLSRILKYAPADLIGREAETRLLDDAWAKAQSGESNRPRVLTFVALGGEGKTSLVAHWAAALSAQGWPGCDAAFAWSFYSQGTRDQSAASSDVFLKEALTFFGDDADQAFVASNAGAFEKGQRLARVVGERKNLLVLDGLEPLQYAPTSPTPGELKDQGVAALLKGLAQHNRGLCLVTTRYSLPDLKAFWKTTAPEEPLHRLSPAAGVSLLQTLGVRGAAQELETLVEDVKGHALTLTLLGGFLHRAFGGDIRQRDRVRFEKADARIDGGHALRTMAAYERWLLRDGGEEGRREVAVLRLLGLFDRPADAGCLAALRREPIAGLTEPLDGLAEDDWAFCLSGLEAARLLAVNRDATGALVSLDAHPHLRAYFAQQLRETNAAAWRAAHRRLYEHLRASTSDKKDAPTLEDLQPLYQAVAHGCLAGMQQEACEKVYHDRITRGEEKYAAHKLGAFGSDLGAIACFFDQPWRRVSPALSEPHRAWLLNQAAFRLRALGRLTEALEPMRAGLENYAKQENRHCTADVAGNLSELELTLGEVTDAVADAAQSVAYADRSGDAFRRMSKRTTHADALHQAGRRAEAEERFREAERMQAKDQPAYPLLYSVRGFRYGDLLLAAAERAAWRTALPSPAGSEVGDEGVAEACRAVSQRAAQTLKIAERHDWLLDIALDHLTLGRAALYEAILTAADVRRARSDVDQAVAGLRRAGTQHELPRGLLARAWLRHLLGARTGPDSAQADLDEAWDIAERGPMRLHLADIHLHRARLFHAATPYPWTSPQADLAAARELIERCGYGRRLEELADAEAAIGRAET